MALLDLVGTVVSGGLTGILGGAFQLLFSWLNTRAETERLRVEGEVKVNIIKAQSEAAKAEYEGKANIEDAKTLAESHKAAATESVLDKVEAPEGTGWGSLFVKALVWLLAGLAEAARMAVRPGLTIYLAVIVTYLYIDAQKMIQAMDVSWHIEMAEQVYVYLVQTLTYLFGVCVSWWFATRKVPDLMRKR